MDELKPIRSYLPARLWKEIVELSENRVVDEVRLRRDMPLSVTVCGENIRGQGCMSATEATEILQAVCGGSLHAHTETLREGFITLGGGIRVGIVGLATAVENHVESVRDISSFVFRIPRWIRGNALPILCELQENAYTRGVLLYSLPGEGKTTLLRELAIALSSPPHRKRVALIDTRKELYYEPYFRGCLCDVLSGYPKSTGISIAVRCLSPQFLICDEIGNEAEAKAILEAHPSGVPLIASVHGKECKEILLRDSISVLIRHKVFGTIFRLQRMQNRIRLTKEWCDG